MNGNQLYGTFLCHCSQVISAILDVGYTFHWYYTFTDMVKMTALTNLNVYYNYLTGSLPQN